MKQALILGCSHATGSEMFPWPQETRYHSYPAVIAQDLGYAVNNLSIPGGSNDAMFRIYEEQKTQPDLIIACWTGFNRTEIWNDNQWQALAPGRDDGDSKLWLSYYATDQIGRLNKIKNILALNTIAQHHGVQVINIDSFWSVDDFAWPDNFYWPANTNFWDWCVENRFDRTPHGHFFEPAHKKFAEIVVEKFKNRG